MRVCRAGVEAVEASALRRVWGLCPGTGFSRNLGWEKGTKQLLIDKVIPVVKQKEGTEGR